MDVFSMSPHTIPWKRSEQQVGEITKGPKGLVFGATNWQACAPCSSAQQPSSSSMEVLLVMKELWRLKAIRTPPSS